MGTVDARLQELGITLPKPAAPVANYVPFVRTGNLVVISGQLCLGPDGKMADAHKGKLGAEISLEAGTGGGAAVRHQRARAAAERARRISTASCAASARRLHQRGAHLRAARPGDERRVRPDGRGVGRQGPPRALDDRRRRTAARCRRSRSKGCSRSDEHAGLACRHCRSRTAAFTTGRRASSRTPSRPPRRPSPAGFPSSATSS